MATKDERREVAARLRNFKTDDVSSYSEYLEKLDEIIGINGCEETGDRLADLIEPEPERTCEMVEQGNAVEYVIWFTCKECFECLPNWDLSKPNYCPNCGAKVVR